MQIDTNRLSLITVDLKLLDAAAKRDRKAMEALGYKTNGEWPGDDFFEALPYFQELLIKNHGTRGFDSWIIVTKDTKEIVGGIGFLGEPSPDGVIEIGFATNESHRRKGYCVEAAQTLLSWAINQDGVEKIIAKCHTDNIGSKYVLEKLGFQTDHSDEDLIHWTYDRSTYQ